MKIKNTCKYSVYLLIAHFIISGCTAKTYDNTTELVVSINDYGKGSSALKYYDASEGCPSYRDFPGAPDYIGKSKVIESESRMQLPLNSKIHVFYFKPKETPEILASGGAEEIRRRSAQIILTGGPARLNLVIDENSKIKWFGEDGIDVESAINCSKHLKE